MLLLRTVELLNSLADEILVSVYLLK